MSNAQMLMVAAGLGLVLGTIALDPRTVPGWLLLALAGWWVWVAGVRSPVEVLGAGAVAATGAVLVVWPLTHRG